VVKVWGGGEEGTGSVAEHPLTPMQQQHTIISSAVPVIVVVSPETPSSTPPLPVRVMTSPTIAIAAATIIMTPIVTFEDCLLQHLQQQRPNKRIKEATKQRAPKTIPGAAIYASACLHVDMVYLSTMTTVIHNCDNRTIHGRMRIRSFSVVAKRQKKKRLRSTYGVNCVCNMSYLTVVFDIALIKVRKGLVWLQVAETSAVQ